MSPLSLSERLLDPDDEWALKVLEYLEEELPRILERQFQAVPGSVDIQGAVASTKRTLWRRLIDGEAPKLERLESINELLGWLYVVARNRVVVQIRHAKVEARYACIIKLQQDNEERDQDMPEFFARLLEQTCTTSIKELNEGLFNILEPRERLLLKGMFFTNPPLTRIEMGKELGVTSRQVGNILDSIRVKCQSLLLPE